MTLLGHVMFLVKNALHVHYMTLHDFTCNRNHYMIYMHNQYVLHVFTCFLHVFHFFYMTITWFLHDDQIWHWFFFFVYGHVPGQLFHEKNSLMFPLLRSQKHQAAILIYKCAWTWLARQWLRRRNFVAVAEVQKQQKREIDAATLITKNIRILIAIRKLAKRKVTFALNCPCHDETDALYLWQDDSRRINAMLDEVESWRSRLTLASFQELVEDLMRRCIRAPKDVAVALTNSKGLPTPRETRSSTRSTTSEIGNGHCGWSGLSGITWTERKTTWKSCMPII